MQITEKLILNCLTELRVQQSKYKTYKRYYEGDHDILYNYAMQDARSNMKVVVNFCKRFIDERVSYITTNPINYISRSGDNEIINVIEKNIAINEKLNNQNLLKQAQIYGKAYALAYLDSNTEFRTLTLTPLNCYVLESERVGEGSILALHTFKQKFDDTEYLDVYTSNQILHYIVKSNNLEYIGSNEHYFGQVPVIVCRANAEERSLIDDIKSLNDSYNNVLSDLVNEVSDFRQCFMKVINAELTEEEALKMKKSGIIHITGDKADINYLTKQINDVFVQNLLQELEEKMFKTVSTIDSNEKMQSNTSSVAIRSRLFLLESICGLIQAELEQAIRQKLQMFFTLYAIKTKKKYTHKDIIIKFTPNIPNDIASLSDSISKLKDIVSQRTLLSLLPFIENPDAEIEQFKKEQEEIIDLDKVDTGDPDAE
ncbi:MAG: hypothetical protein PWQ70_2194 [Clostridiales bacterium]|nr:hypothetical protein [Clostridiales bacterium]